MASSHWDYSKFVTLHPCLFQRYTSPLADLFIPTLHFTPGRPVYSNVTLHPWQTCLFQRYTSSLADLFIPTPSRLLREAICNYCAMTIHSLWMEECSAGYFRRDTLGWSSLNLGMLQGSSSIRMFSFVSLQNDFAKIHSFQL